MSNFNKVFLMGNLTRDPETRSTNKGTAVTRFTLAVNRRYTTEAGEAKEEVTFVDIDAWGKMAEAIAKYGKRGKPMHIEGRLKLEQWDDKATGQKRSRMGVVLESFQFLGPRDPMPQQTGRPGPPPSDPAPTASAPLDDVPF